MNKNLLAIFLCFFLCSCNKHLGSLSARPNVILIIIDDMNTWISVLNDKQKIHTPNFERLAKRGITFTQAYAPSTLCEPSRAATFTGLYPFRNGIISNDIDDVSCMLDRDIGNIFNYFKDHNYSVHIAGKLFHKRSDLLIDYDSGIGWYETPNRDDKRDWRFEWYAYANKQNGTPLTDDQSTLFAKNLLQQKHKDPFFLGLGFIKPHLPWIVPKKFFDLYPLDEIKLEEYVEGDLDDVPEKAKQIAQTGIAHWKAIMEAKKENEAIQAYLAAISYTDEKLGEVLDALEASPYDKNTIIVLLSDHGYHMGSKEAIRKGTLWEESAHIPYFVSIPNFENNGKKYTYVTPVIDTYATLVELCNLPKNETINGTSLVPVLKDPNLILDQPAITTLYNGNFSIRTNEWRYINYQTKSEELYDVVKDPLQLTNLADDPNYKKQKQKLKKYLPKDRAELCPTLDASQH